MSLLIITGTIYYKDKNGRITQTRAETRASQHNIRSPPIDIPTETSRQSSGAEPAGGRSFETRSGPRSTVADSKSLGSEQHARLKTVRGDGANFERPLTSRPRPLYQYTVSVGESPTDAPVSSRLQQVDYGRGQDAQHPVSQDRPVNDATGLRAITRAADLSQHSKPSNTNARSSIKGKSPEVDDEDPFDDNFGVLKGVAKFFAAIPENDFQQRAVFLSDNLELLSVPLADFLQEAIKQMKSRNDSAATRCMECMVIIHLCQSFRNKLNRRGAVADMQYQVNAMGDEATEDYNEFGRTYENVLLNVRTASGPGDDLLEGMTNAGVQFTNSQMTSKTEKVEKLLQKEPEYKKLSNKYKIKPGRWFTVGTIFAMLWHESVGENTKPGGAEKDKVMSTDVLSQYIVKGPYGEDIYTHIRRFVVIRNRHGYCWCLSINSYGGQGIGKRGLKDEERAAHTMIHDSTRPPRRMEGEPPMAKRPIAVLMTQGETLTDASRLNYGRPYSVDWNTKVMSIGRVKPDLLPIVLTDARAEIFGDDGSAARPATSASRPISRVPGPAPHTEPRNDLRRPPQPPGRNKLAR